MSGGAPHPADEAFFERDGVTLCCVSLGGRGPAALLLHGLAGRGLEWRSTGEWLNRTHRVLALDQRAHGRSTRRPVDLGRDAYVGDAIAAIEQLGLAPAVLVGQSLGGLNALLVAARRPDLVRALIVAEADPSPDPSGSDAVAGWLDSWPVPFPTRAAARAFFGGDTLWAATWADSLEESADGYAPAFERDCMLRSLDDAGHDYWPEWSRVRCPALVVAGEHGGLGRDALARMLACVPNGRGAVVAGAGHDLHLDQPGRWRGVVEPFLASLDRSR